jgi:hypothetical protein
MDRFIKVKLIVGDGQKATSCMPITRFGCTLGDLRQVPPTSAKNAVSVEHE